MSFPLFLLLVIYTTEQIQSYRRSKQRNPASCASIYKHMENPTIGSEFMCWSWTRTAQDSSSSYAYDELDDPNALWSAFVFFSSLSSLRACAPLTPSSAAVATTESRSDRQTDHQPMTPGFTMHMIVITYLHCLWDVQDYIVYLGHLPSTESDTSSEADGAGLSTIEAAHHDLLNQVLDDGRSNNKLAF